MQHQLSCQEHHLAHHEVSGESRSRSQQLVACTTWTRITKRIDSDHQCFDNNEQMIMWYHHLEPIWNQPPKLPLAATRLFLGLGIDDCGFTKRSHADQSSNQRDERFASPTSAAFNYSQLDRGSCFFSHLLDIHNSSLSLCNQVTEICIATSIGHGTTWMT